MRPVGRKRRAAPPRNSRLCHARGPAARARAGQPNRIAAPTAPRSPLDARTRARPTPTFRVSALELGAEAEARVDLAGGGSRRAAGPGRVERIDPGGLVAHRRGRRGSRHRLEACHARRRGAAERQRPSREQGLGGRGAASGAVAARAGGVRLPLALHRAAEHEALTFRARPSGCRPVGHAGADVAGPAPPPHEGGTMAGVRSRVTESGYLPAPETRARASTRHVLAPYVPALRREAGQAARLVAGVEMRDQACRYLIPTGAVRPAHPAIAVRPVLRRHRVQMQRNVRAAAWPWTGSPASRSRTPPSAVTRLPRIWSPFTRLRSLFMQTRMPETKTRVPKAEVFS